MLAQGTEDSHWKFVPSLYGQRSKNFYSKTHDFICCSRKLSNDLES